MTAVSGNYIDYTNWYSDSTVTDTSETSSTSSVSEEYVTSGSAADDSSGDVFSLSTNTGCTDGSDDGKIGILSVVSNVVKGAGKTVVNAVKGCFTDSEGNFSLGKTLTTIGVAALCTAIPALGLAACAIGGTMGAIQIGKGVYNAATAETDAEAKEAWQNVGGGALTVGLSVTGAKASYNAVEASAASETGATAMNSLSENASILQKAGALAKDCVSSTKNNASSIASSVSETASVLKESGLQKLRDTGKAVRESYSNSGNKVNTKNESTSKSILETVKGAVSSLKDNVFSKASSIKNSAKNGTLKTDVQSKLSTKGQEILSALKEGSASFEEIAEQYGYKDLAQVLKVVSGVLVTEEEV